MKKSLAFVIVLLVVSAIVMDLNWRGLVSASTGALIFFDDFNSGDYSNNWIAGNVSLHYPSRTTVVITPIVDAWKEYGGYLIGTDGINPETGEPAGGDWIYIYAKFKIPTRGIIITARVKLQDDSNAVIALIPDDPKNNTHIIAGADIVAYPSNSGWYAFSGNGYEVHRTGNVDGSVVNGKWYTVKIVIPPNGSQVKVYDGDTGELKVVDDYYTVPNTTAYLVLDARGSWGSGANVTFDYVKVTSLTSAPSSPVIYKDKILEINLRDYSILKMYGYDWLKNYPEPKLPYLWIVVTYGQPGYYSSFKIGQWENVKLVENNSEKTVYQLSTTLQGPSALPFTQTMTFYRNSGLIKIERYKVLDNGWGVEDTINGISPGGDTANDYIVSSEFSEHPINYRDTFCTGTDWTACQEYTAESLKGYHGYVYLAAYDKQKKQGFAIIVPKEYIKDTYSDIRYSVLRAFFTEPTTYWKAWRWYISIQTDSTKNVVYYWYFYKFTNDPTAPIKKLIDSGMNPHVARELTGTSSYPSTQTSTTSSTSTSTTTTNTPPVTTTSTVTTTTTTSTLAPIANSAIDTAKDILSKVPSSVDTGDAQTMLDEAQKAYENGDYELAEKFAKTAQALAVKAYYDDLRAKLQVKESQGQDVSEASNLLQQAYNAYQRKDYTAALEILTKADLVLQGVQPKENSLLKYLPVLLGLVGLVVVGFVYSKRKKVEAEKLRAEFEASLNSGDNIVEKDPFSALEYYSKAFSMAKRLGDSHLVAKAQEKLNTVRGTVTGEINSLMAKGDEALKNGDYDKALAYYREALNLAEKLHDAKRTEEAREKMESVHKVRKIRELISEGDVLMEQERYSEALKRYREALEIAKGLGDSYFIELLKGRASRANEIVERLNGEVSSLVASAERDMMEEDYESAREKLSQAIVLAEKIGGTVSVEEIKAKLEEAKARNELNEKLKAARGSGDYSKAVALYREALKLAQSIGDERMVAQINSEIEEVEKSRVLETLRNGIELILPKEVPYGRETTLSINVENRLGETINDLTVDLSELSPYFVMDGEKVTFPPIKPSRRLGKDIRLKPQFKGDFDFNVKISSSIGETVKPLRIKVGDYYAPSQFTPRPLTPKSAPEELEALYEDFQYIGEGGFARVFKAKRKKDGKVVAVKVPKTLDPATGKAFVREISNWLHLKHPNIVELHDVNVIPIPYLEMEYCEGSLAKLGKPMDVERAAHIIFNIAEGLKYAHARKIIHRDLKPSNILLKNGLPKISDWGLSKVMSESRSSTLSSFTPYYAAPEQLSPRRFGGTDERTDIWQLGVLFYELVTGKMPFEGRDLGEITYAIINENPALPSELNPEAKLVEPIIMKMLAKDKEKRYASVEELQRDLAKVLNMTYVEGLKKSTDLKRTVFYIGDLALINLKAGNLKEALKYFIELRDYAGKYGKELDNLIDQIKLAMDEGVKLGEEAVMKADVIVHQIKMGR
ncbi:protein kinase [Thermococcus sp.]|uniref:protein kinase domain-containing protein n=1 Tax=Thermococcus sp. TaxID=35749 RepID=UPI0025E71382|nr:protein kinase [Thermococcus sp.]